jgi:hypothetical protein
MVRTAASVSALAQSIWASFMENHLDEVAQDPEGAWAVLAKAARRHCEKWNRRATRHPQSSLDEPGADVRTPAPEIAVLAREYADLFELLSGDDREEAGGKVARSAAEVPAGFVQNLTPGERAVLGLKLAGRPTKDIAAQLGLDETEVRRFWQSVRKKSRADD